MTEASITIDFCWQLPNRALAEEHGPAMLELRTWLAARKDSVAIALTQDPSRTWTKKEMRSVERDIVGWFRPMRCARAMITYLHYVVRQWILLTEQNCSLPRIAFLRSKASNPFRHNPAKALREHALARTRLHEVIENSTEDANGNNANVDWLALALISAILEFGVLHRDVVRAVVAVLAYPTKGFFSLGSHVALYLHLPVRGIPDSEHRIWVPDPLTATLLLRVDPADARALIENFDPAAQLPQQDRELHAALQERMASALSMGGGNTRRAKFSISKLISASTQVAQYWLPFALVAYLSRKFVSHSVRPEVLARIDKSVQLLSLTPVPRATPEVSSPTEASDQEGTETSLRASATHSLVPDDCDWLPHLRGAMRSDSRPQIRRKLAELMLRKDLPPMATRLAELALALLNRPGQKPLGLRTLRAYIVLLAKFVGPPVGEDDPADLARTGGIEGLYLDAIEDHADSRSGHSLSSQRKFDLCVLMFHRLFTEKYGAPPLEDLRGLVLGCLPVDANILSEAEFQRVLCAIRKSRAIPASQRVVAVLLLIFGYRCGLRRNEAYFLRVCDIDAGDLVMLLVWETADRKLKSHNAQRRQNLTVLLTKPELDLLLEFCAQQKKQGGPLALLFEVQAQVRETLLGEDALFVEIHRIMRLELEDFSLRFHHGRHSFGTLLVLRLMAQSSAAFRSMLPQMLYTAETIEKADAFRLGLFDSVDITAIDLQAVADMLGHGSPQMSLTHYIHCFCLLVASRLQSQPALAPAKHTVVAASGLPSNHGLPAGHNRPFSGTSASIPTPFR